PQRPASIPAAWSVGGSSRLVASSGSYPAMAERRVAASRTSRVSVPTWSSDEANAMRPYLEMRPYVGLSPTMPQREAGWRTDPPVSVPSAHTASPAATAAADPPEDPPGTRPRSHGFRTGPKAEFSFEDPMANSSQLVLPIRTAPASWSRTHGVQSYGGTYGSRIFDPAVLRMPFVASTSLRATGMPPTGGGRSPLRIESSIRLACSIPTSRVGHRNA